MPIEENPDLLTLEYLLGQVGRLHHGREQQAFRELGLHRGQPPLLFALWEEDGQTVGQLAARLGVAQATATRMVQRMERAGFVQRQADPADERRSRVFLAVSGRAVRDRLRSTSARMELAAFAGFSRAEREDLHGYLERLRANLERAGRTQAKLS